MKSLSKDPSQRQNSLRLLQTELADAIRIQPWWQKKWRQAACVTVFCAAALYASGYVVQPFWVIDGQTDQPVVTPSPPDPEISPTAPGDAAISILPPVPADAVKLGRLNLAGSNLKTLAAGNYQCDYICLSDSSKLTFDGDVNLWITPGAEDDSALTISGQAQLCSSSKPERLKIYYSSNKNIVMKGEATLKATVLAPRAILHASGKSTIEGTFTSAGQN